jgi:hypothetical protein
MPIDVHARRFSWKTKRTRGEDSEPFLDARLKVRKTLRRGKRNLCVRIECTVDFFSQLLVRERILQYMEGYATELGRNRFTTCNAELESQWTHRTSSSRTHTSVDE